MTDPSYSEKMIKEKSASNRALGIMGLAVAPLLLIIVAIWSKGAVLGCGAMLLLVAVFSLAYFLVPEKFARRALDQEMKKFGDPHVLLAQLDAEVAAPHWELNTLSPNDSTSSAKNLHITPSWLIHAGQVIPLEQITRAARVKLPAARIAAREGARYGILLSLKGAGKNSLIEYGGVDSEYGIEITLARIKEQVPWAVTVEE